MGKRALHEMQKNEKGVVQLRQSGGRVGKKRESIFIRGDKKRKIFCGTEELRPSCLGQPSLGIEWRRVAKETGSPGKNF